MKMNIVQELLRCMMKYPFWKGPRGRRCGVRMRYIQGRRGHDDLRDTINRAFMVMGVGKEKSNMKIYYEKIRKEYICARRERIEYQRIRRREVMRRKKMISNDQVRQVKRSMTKLISDHVDNGDMTMLKKSRDEWLRWWNGQCRRHGVWDSKSRKHVAQVMVICKRRVRDVIDYAKQKRERSDETKTEMGTLKVVSYNCGSYRKRVYEMVEEMADADIIALQETNIGDVDVKPPFGWKFCSNERPGGSGGGTGFLVRQELKWERMRKHWGRNMREGESKTTIWGMEWCWIRVRAAKGWLYLASVYRPPGRAVSYAEGLVDQIRDFEGRAESLGVILMGDFNCLLADKELVPDGFGGVDGGYALDGQQWLKMFGELKYTILNTMDGDMCEATHRVKRKTTMISSVIDYMICFGSSEGISAFSVSDSCTDHRYLSCLVNCEMMVRPYVPRIRMDRLRKKHDVRYVTWTKNMQQRLDETFGDVTDMSMTEWTDGVVDVAAKVLGLTKQRKSKLQKVQPWWNKDMTVRQKEIRKLQREIWKKKVEAEVWCEMKQDLKQKVKELRQMMKTSMRHFWKNKRELWSLGEPEAIREAFKTVKRLHSGGGGNGVIHTREEMEDAWRGVLSVKPPDECNERECVDILQSMKWCYDDYEEVTCEEVQRCIETLPNNKACGSDEISNELMKLLPESAVSALTIAMNSFLKDPFGEIPDAWRRNLVVLLPKEAVPSDPLKYRPITLLSCVAKLTEKVIYERTKDMNVHLHFDQGGFVAGRGCIEQAWRFKVFDDAMRYKKKKGWALFLDLKKAYDSVPIHMAVVKLLKKGLPQYIVRYIWAWMLDHGSELMVDNDPATPIPVLRGVPQGSILSPFIFNCYIDDLIEKLSVDGLQTETTMRPRSAMHGEDFSFSLQVLGYADDLGVVDDVDGEFLARACEICASWMRENGMRFAEKKCVLKKIGAQGVRKDLGLMMNGVKLQTVTEFKYLGVVFGKSNQIYSVKDDVMKDIDKRLESNFTGLESMYGTPVDVGIRMVLAIYLPKVLYGCEIFPVKDELERKVVKLLRKVLNCYGSDSSERVMSFTGMRKIEEYQYVRVIRFVFKTLLSVHEQLAVPMRHAMRSRTKWGTHVEKAWEWGRENGYLSIGCHDLRTMETEREAVKQYLREFNLQYGAKKHLRRPHPAVRYGGLSAQFAFIFFRGNFNPNDITSRQGDYPCRCCQEEGAVDDAHHLLECSHPTVSKILKETAELLDTTSETIRQILKQQCKPDHDWQWMELSVACERLWKLRKAEMAKAKAAKVRQQ